MTIAMTQRAANLLGALTQMVADEVRDLPGATLTVRAALVAISKNAGASIDAVRACLGLSHPAAVRVVSGLVDAELITKDIGTDRRSVALRLTLQGQQAVEQILKQREALLEGVLNQLSASEKQQFEQLAIKILWHETRNAAHAMHLCRLCDEGECMAIGCPISCKEFGQPMPS
jgi:DNA-binding MarR family transcriptional regulator